jgi:hypothetical protein
MNKPDDYTKMNNKEVMVKIKIMIAYRKLLKNDSHLLEVDANERSITHRFAIYLEDEFPNYNVDCEYNRNGLETKRLNLLKKEICSDDTNGVTVYPDIIIHHRGTKDNFIVIEAKKTTTNNNNNDKEKLEAYKNDLKYRHAFFVNFPIKEDFSNFNGNFDNYIQEINTRLKN